MPDQSSERGYIQRQKDTRVEPQTTQTKTHTVKTIEFKVSHRIEQPSDSDKLSGEKNTLFKHKKKSKKKSALYLTFGAYELVWGNVSTTAYFMFDVTYSLTPNQPIDSQRSQATIGLC